MEINVSKCCLQLGWIFFHYNGPIFFRSTLKSPYDGYNLVFFCSTGNKYIFSKLVDDFTFHFFLAFLLQTFIYTDVSFPCNSIAIIVCYSLLLIFQIYYSSFSKVFNSLCTTHLSKLYYNVYATRQFFIIFACYFLSKIY